MPLMCLSLYVIVCCVLTMVPTQIPRVSLLIPNHTGDELVTNRVKERCLPVYGGLEFN